MSLQIGLSSFVLASPFSDADLSVAPHVSGMGYGVLEVCVEDPTLLSAAAIRTAAADNNLLVSICGAFGPDRDVSHEDESIRRKGIAYLKTCVDLAAEVNSPYVSGPMYSATGKTRLLSPEKRKEQWNWAVESLREVGEYAVSKNVGLAIEPLNRFETDLINTVEQAVDLCKAINVKNVGLLLDTFHMNIEEKSIGLAIMAAKDYLFHIQVSENDRGTPGSGQVHWDEFFKALKSINYKGWIVVESFLPTVAEIARAVSLWRPVASSMEDLARDGYQFISRSLETHGL